MVIKSLLIATLLFILSCASSRIRNSVYNLEDVDPSLKEYLIKNGLEAPGKVCGTFKGAKEHGCFLLLNDGLNNFASELVYQDNEGKRFIIERFEPPINYIYLQKKKFKKISSSKSLPDEKEFHFDKLTDAVIVNIFERSAFVIFWNGVKFDKIYISD